MEKGYERFLGFADLYDEGRPRLPKKTIEILDSTLENIFEGKTLNALFSYKMKIGIK